MKIPYETMFLLPPTADEERVNEFIGRLQESVEKKYGEMKNVQKMGVRKTAYRVNKLDSAYYVLIQYDGNGETINEVERLLKNSDDVLKFLSTKITTKTPAAQAIPVLPLEDKSNRAEESESKASMTEEEEPANLEFKEDIPEIAAPAAMNGSKE